MYFGNCGPSVLPQMPTLPPVCVPRGGNYLAESNFWSQCMQAQQSLFQGWQQFCGCQPQPHWGNCQPQPQPQWGNCQPQPQWGNFQSQPQWGNFQSQPQWDNCQPPQFGNCQPQPPQLGDCQPPEVHVHHHYHYHYHQDPCPPQSQPVPQPVPQPEPRPVPVPLTRTRPLPPPPVVRSQPLPTTRNYDGSTYAAHAFRAPGGRNFVGGGLMTRNTMAGQDLRVYLRSS
jgi:hypothetical protein